MVSLLAKFSKQKYLAKVRQFLKAYLDSGCLSEDALMEGFVSETAQT